MTLPWYKSQLLLGFRLLLILLHECATVAICTFSFLLKPKAVWPQLTINSWLHYLIRKCTNAMSANRVVLSSAVSISPYWNHLSEAPTLGWRDESLMASGFHNGVMFLSCILYPCFYWLCGCISLCLSLYHLFVLGICYCFLLLYSVADYITEQWVQVYVTKQNVLTKPCCSKYHLL